jgi:N-methylhydantoinase A
MLPTVTDANFLLGRLDTESFLGGGVNLDHDRTEKILTDQKGPIATAEEFAAGILRVVETQMEKAIRVISVERGHDPRDFTLVAFGGGGPLHACALARALRIPRVLVPALPGALSAVGILLADVVRDYSRTVMLPGDAIHNLADHFAELESLAAVEFKSEGLEGTPHRTLDLRYRRQGYELNVDYDPHSPANSIDAFHRQHHHRYGFSDPARPIEIVNLRLRVTSAGELYTPPRRALIPGNGAAACYAERPVSFKDQPQPTRFYRREQLVPGDTLPGPAMITEYTSATLLPPGATATIDAFSNIVVTVGEEVEP